MTNMKQINAVTETKQSLMGKFGDKLLSFDKYGEGYHMQLNDGKS